MEFSPHLEESRYKPNIPSYFPKLDEPVWNEVIPDRFSYYLTSDEETWNSYVAATTMNEKYNVDILDVISAQKFSSFIL